MKNKKLAARKLWNQKVLPLLKDPFFLGRWEEDEPFRRRDPDRITVWTNDGYKRLIGRDDYQGELFMFMQDMHQAIMPYGRLNGTPYSAELVPDDTALTRTLADALSTHGYHELRESLEAFIREAAQSLFYYADVFYEVACQHDAEGKITKIEFHDIYPPSMKKIFGQYFQIVPWKAAKHGRVKAGIHFIPRDKILHIDFPKQLGGGRRLRKIIKRLVVLSRTLIPAFQMKAMERNENIGFNLDHYTKAKYIEIAQLTNKFGWNQRQFRDANILEYYSMYRHLYFVRSQAIVREHIIRNINKAVNGRIINAGVEIVIKDLITSKDAESEFETLRKGDLSFEDLIMRTHF